MNKDITLFVRIIFRYLSNPEVFIIQVLHGNFQYKLKLSFWVSREITQDKVFL